MSSNPKTKSYGLDYPLAQTFVMSNLVYPFLPAYTPHEAAQLQIKKTSWKNIKKFLKSIDKQRIIKSKDVGNEVVIVDINFEDRAILAFTPYRLPKKETSAGPSQSRGDTATSQMEMSGDSSINQTLKCLSLYKPKDRLSDLFTAAKADAKAFYTAAEVKSKVSAYVESEELVSNNNKRIVKLNPYLANSIFDGSKGAADKEILARGTVPRDILADRVLASCAPFHLITRNDSTSNGVLKPKAGGPPKITVTLETRSGNKTATKVSGLEPYFISPQPLADELRKACAGSTSVERMASSSPKNPVMEVMVQGPQREAVLKALERRGVDRRWVDFVDKTKGKKKG
jgi:translation initiation factor 2D